MKSKYLATYLNHISNLSADIEFADVINISLNEGRLHDDAAELIFHDVKVDKHELLKKRKNTGKSRILVIRHLKATLYIAFIKEIYEEVTLYFKGLLKIAITNGIPTERIVGEHKVNFNSIDILQRRSWDAVVDYVIDSIVQQLENERSTLALIKKMNCKLNLSVDESIINNALPYLEVRHLLVHMDGKANSEFKTNNPNFTYDENDRISLDFDHIIKTRDVINELIKEFDKKAIGASLIPLSEQQK